MSQPKESVNTDVMGRVLSLEQRTKGLQGRISAIELRLSGTAGHDCAGDPGITWDVEFVPASQLSGRYMGQESPDARLSTPGQTAKPDSIGPGRQRAWRPVDATGVVGGAILVGAGLLLYAGNIDIIKNPLLSLGCGIFLIAISFARSIMVKTI